MSEPRKLVFAAGCFDRFEGTQEELEEFKAEIIRQFESGELFDDSEDFDPEVDDLGMEPNEIAHLKGVLEAITSGNPVKRVLN